MGHTRDRLVAATNELFRRNGYNGTSMSGVTTAAGVPTGSLYHFFPGGKDELAEAVLIESGASYRALFELIAAEASDPAQAIADFFDGAATALEETDFIDPCPIGTVAREVASINDRLRCAAAQVFTSWTDAATAHFESAGLAADEASELATTVIAAIEGGFVLARSHRDADLLRTIGRHTHHLVAVTLAERSQGQVHAGELPRRSTN